MSSLFSSRWRRELVIVVIYAVLALILTYPLLLHLDTHVSGPPVDAPALAWNLWWMKFALFDRGINPLYSNYVYFPIGVNFVAYTSTFLNGVLSLPLQFAFGTIVANNLLVYFSLVLGGYGTFLLARDMLPRQTPHADLAAGLAGAFYAFGAWHINYVWGGSFMLVSNEWIPFFAFYLLRLNRNAWRNGALAGLFFVLTSWTELTFIPFLALLTALYLLYLLVVNRASLNRSLLRNLIALTVVTAIGVSPLAWSLITDTLHYGYFLSSGLGRVQVFSADLLSYVIPSGLHPILGAWAQDMSNANRSYAYIGFGALVLAIIGIIAGRKSEAARFWGVAALFFALILLGPLLIVDGQVTGIPMPFALLQKLPFINANRYPVRFNVMMMLALAVLIAYGAAWLLKTRRGAFALAALGAVLLFEQLLVPLPLSDLRAAPILETISKEPGDFAVLDLPLGWRNSTDVQGKIDNTAQFYQTTHNKRLLGGLTSRNPLFKFQYFLELPVINSIIALENGGTVDEETRAHDRQLAPAILQFFGIRYIQAQKSLTPAPVLEYVRDIFPLTQVYADDDHIVYHADSAADPAQGEFDPASEIARAAFDYGWGRPEVDSSNTGYRWATDEQARMWLPLTPGAYDFTFQLRGAHPAQHVTLRMNDQVAAAWDLTDGWDSYSAHLPAETIHDGLNEFIFQTDTTPLAQASPDTEAIGKTGVRSPVDISATGAGFDAGKFGEIFVAGRNLISNTRGYHLVAIDPKSGAVTANDAFDTFADPAESTRLADFVNNVPEGFIVTGVAIDDVSRYLRPDAVNALHVLGVTEDLHSRFRTGHAFIGVKGAPPGTALESADARFPANVYAGKNVRAPQVSFGLGRISYQMLQP